MAEENYSRHSAKTIQTWKSNENSQKHDHNTETFLDVIESNDENILGSSSPRNTESSSSLKRCLRKIRNPKKFRDTLINLMHSMQLLLINWDKEVSGNDQLPSSKVIYDTISNEIKASVTRNTNSQLNGNIVSESYTYQIQGPITNLAAIQDVLPQNIDENLQDQKTLKEKPSRTSQLDYIVEPRVCHGNKKLLRGPIRTMNKSSVPNQDMISVAENIKKANVSEQESDKSQSLLVKSQSLLVKSQSLLEEIILKPVEVLTSIRSVRRQTRGNPNNIIKLSDYSISSSEFSFDQNKLVQEIPLNTTKRHKHQENENTNNCPPNSCCCKSSFNGDLSKDSVNIKKGTCLCSTPSKTIHCDRSKKRFSGGTASLNISSPGNNENIEKLTSKTLRSQISTNNSHIKSNTESTSNTQDISKNKNYKLKTNENTNTPNTDINNISNKEKSSTSKDNQTKSKNEYESSDKIIRSDKLNMINDETTNNLSDGLTNRENKNESIYKQELSKYNEKNNKRYENSTEEEEIDENKPNKRRKHCKCKPCKHYQSLDKVREELDTNGKHENNKELSELKIQNSSFSLQTIEKLKKISKLSNDLQKTNKELSELKIQNSSFSLQTIEKLKKISILNNDLKPNNILSELKIQNSSFSLQTVEKLKKISKLSNDLQKPNNKRKSVSVSSNGITSNKDYDCETICESEYCGPPSAPPPSRAPSILQCACRCPETIQLLLNLWDKLNYISKNKNDEEISYLKTEIERKLSQQSYKSVRKSTSQEKLGSLNKESILLHEQSIRWYFMAPISSSICLKVNEKAIERHIILDESILEEFGSNLNESLDLYLPNDITIKWYIIQPLEVNIDRSSIEKPNIMYILLPFNSDQNNNKTLNSINNKIYHTKIDGKDVRINTNIILELNNSGMLLETSIVDITNNKKLKWYTLKPASSRDRAGLDLDTNVNNANQSKSPMSSTRTSDFDRSIEHPGPSYISQDNYESGVPLKIPGYIQPEDKSIKWYTLQSANSAPSGSNAKRESKPKKYIDTQNSSKIRNIILDEMVSTDFSTVNDESVKWYRLALLPEKNRPENIQTKNLNNSHGPISSSKTSNFNVSISHPDVSLPGIIPSEGRTIKWYTLKSLNKKNIDANKIQQSTLDDEVKRIIVNDSIINFHPINSESNKWYKLETILENKSSSITIHTDVISEQNHINSDTSNIPAINFGESPQILSDIREFKSNKPRRITDSSIQTVRHFTLETIPPSEEELVLNIQNNAIMYNEQQVIEPDNNDDEKYFDEIPDNPLSIHTVTSINKPGVTSSALYDPSVSVDEIPEKKLSFYTAITENEPHVIEPDNDDKIPEKPLSIHTVISTNKPGVTNPTLYDPPVGYISRELIVSDIAESREKNSEAIELKTIESARKDESGRSCCSNPKNAYMEYDPPVSHISSELIVSAIAESREKISEAIELKTIESSRKDDSVRSIKLSTEKDLAKKNNGCGYSACCDCPKNAYSESNNTKKFFCQQNENSKVVGENDEKFKSFVKDICQDLKKMKNTINRKMTNQMTRISSNSCQISPNNLAKWRTLNEDQCPESTSFPVSIQRVRPIGKNSIIIQWVIHDIQNIGGYKITVDGCITNRYYSSGHDTAVICGVNTCSDHLIVLDAVPTYDCFKNTPKLITQATDSENFQLLQENRLKSKFWTPSCYLYDPKMSLSDKLKSN